MAAFRCHFWRLPAELRVSIYEYVYEGFWESRPVRLVDASPPSKDVLLSCRQMYKEVWPIYAQLYRQYWTENDFVISHHSVVRGSLLDAQRTKFLTLRPEDLDHIMKLNLWYRCSFSQTMTYTFSHIMTLRMLNDRGAWCLTSCVSANGDEIIGSRQLIGKQFCETLFTRSRKSHARTNSATFRWSHANFASDLAASGKQQHPLSQWVDFLTDPGLRSR